MARHREKPKSIGPTIGIVLCLGAIGGFLLLYMAGVFNPKKDDGGGFKPPPTAGGPAKTPAKNPTNGGAVRTTAPAVPGQVVDPRTADTEYEKELKEGVPFLGPAPISC